MQDKDYEYKMYPRGVKDLAYELRRVCDDYKTRQLNNEDFAEVINYYVSKYPNLLFDGPTEYNATMVRLVGVRRLRVMDAVIDGQQIMMRGAK